MSTHVVNGAGRIDARFRALKAAGRAGLITFITAGDPDAATALALLKGLPGAGADLIELGIPFTDPMADGPAIQASSLRALAAGARLSGTLDLVRAFRQDDDATPLILMGYYNPIYAYGVERFLADARAAGVDGLIIVDLPPEEDEELCLPAMKAGINFIRLTTPTSRGDRLPVVAANTSGFLYYVSITGVTGAGSASAGSVADAVARLRGVSDLPVAVGFGITTPEQAADVARVADAAVVGSAIVRRVEAGLDADGRPTPRLVPDVLGFVRQMADGVHSARK